MSDPATILGSGLAEMGLSLQPRQQKLLLIYVDLLMKWNRAYNLSAIRNAPEMVRKHLLDSLTLVPFLEAESETETDTRRSLRILDVGTGPGLPGIPLALCFPDHHFVLLDSNGKKSRFLFQARLALELENITIENDRIECYQSSEPIDTLVCRAFSSLADLVTRSQGLRGRQRQRIVAMKGVYPEEELEQLRVMLGPDSAVTITTSRVMVPGVTAERHIVEIAHPEGK